MSCRKGGVPPTGIRLAAILLAGAVSVATSVPPGVRVETPPDQAFLEREGVVVCTFRCFRAFRVAGDSKHLDATFVVKNERANSVRFSTKNARLYLDRLEVENRNPRTFLLRPGEAKKVYARFDLPERDLMVIPARPYLRLGEATLPDNRSLPFGVDLETRAWKDREREED